MSCCTNTYNLGCFNNCSIIAVGLCLTSGTYNGVFTYGNISTTITVTAIENEPFLFDLSLLNENATFTLAIYDENENQITLTIDSVDYDCFKVKTQVDSVKVTQGTIIGCTPMCKEIYDPNDENTAVLFTVAVDGTTITGDGTVGNPLIAIGGGGGGGIESIVAGDNITIDNTDPLNPIINGSSLLFPNGREIITSSRDFQQSDEGKILIVVGNNIALTMPDASIWTEVGIPIGLKFYQGYTGCSYEAAHGVPNKVLQLSSDGEFITVITGEYLGKSSVGTIANMQVNSDGEIVTLNKYLYDKVQSMGSSALLPNGVKLVTESRDLDSSDAGYILALYSETEQIILTIPTPSPLAVGDNFAITISDPAEEQNSLFIYNGDSMRALVGELVFFTTTVDNGQATSYSTNNTFIDGNTDIKYLYDQSQNAISLYSGLESSKQDTLVSGTNIKTINGTTILGSGDMTVGGQVDILQIQMFI